MYSTAIQLIESIYAIDIVIANKRCRYALMTVTTAHFVIRTFSNNYKTMENRVCFFVVALP